MTEALPRIASRTPFEVTVKAGRTYYWCVCGLSKKQPFCDGSHKGSELTPHPFTAAADETVWLCGCKRTGGRPFCDGTHNGLPPA